MYDEKCIFRWVYCWWLDCSLLRVPILWDEAAKDLFGGAISLQRESTDFSNNESVIRIGILTSLLAGLGYSLFSGVIVMPLSQLWMVLIGGGVRNLPESRSRE